MRVIGWALLGFLALCALPIVLLVLAGLIRRFQIARTARELQRMGFVGSAPPHPRDSRPLWPILAAGLIGSTALIVATVVLPGPPASRMLASTAGSSFPPPPTQASSSQPAANPGAQHTSPSEQPVTTHGPGSSPATQASSGSSTPDAGGGAGAPSSVRALPTSGTAIQLHWAPVNGAVRYDVERSTDNADWETVRSTSGTRYTDVALSSGTTYYYRVAAVVDGGDASRSDVVSATTTVDTPAPPVLSQPTGSATSVDVAWSDVTGADGYQIERSPDGVSGWTGIGNTGEGVTTFTDADLEPTTTYYYRVVAVTSDGESSPPSNVRSATTGPGESSTSQSEAAPSVAPTGP